jgi:hypothetical protein
MPRFRSGREVGVNPRVVAVVRRAAGDTKVTAVPAAVDFSGVVSGSDQCWQIEAVAATENE